MGYFSSVVEEIKEHMAAYILCQGAQVYWWLRRRGYVTDHVNHLIRHYFTLSQQQKVTKSKYLKDLGHTIIDQTDTKDIINAATTQGIYDLTLGLSDKEQRTFVAKKAHKATLITFGKAKEGAVETHNFLLQASITTTHTHNKKKRYTVLVATARTLTKSVFSIGTLNRTSKVTEDDLEGRKEEDKSMEEMPEREEKRIAIEGMKMLAGSKAILFKTSLVKRGRDKSKMDKEEEEEQEFDDFDVEMKKLCIELTERTKEMSGLLNTSLEDEEEVYNTLNVSMVDPLDEDKGEKFSKANFSKYMDNKNLKLEGYNLDILKVSSGEFEVAHTQKYQEPANFLQALWNMAITFCVGSIKIHLNMLGSKLKGKLAGIPADNSNMPILLVDYLVKEVGEDTGDTINYINKIASKLEEYDKISVKNLEDGGERFLDSNRPVPDKGGGQQDASKTQGMLPAAPMVNSTEEVAMDTATAAGEDKRERNP
jgi:hypothetical protein